MANEVKDKYSSREEFESRMHGLDPFFRNVVNPLIFNEAVFITNEYLREHGEKPLTVSQCKYLRHTLFEELYDNAYNEMLTSRRYNQFYSEPDKILLGRTMDNIFEHDGEPGLLETFLKENNMFPQNPEQSLSEFAVSDKENPFDAESTYAVCGEIHKKNKKVFDIFGRRDEEDIDIADLSLTQAFLNPHKYKQTNILFEYNDYGEERKNYEPFSFSRENILVESVDNDNITKFDFYSTKNGAVRKLNVPSVKKLMTNSDKMGLYKLRPYINEDDYDRIAKKLEKDTNYSDNVTMNEQAIKNALAICHDLERRGLPFKIEEDKLPGQLKATVDLGKKETLSVRIFDYNEPNYVGRTYNGSVSYFRSEAYADKIRRAAYFPDENDVLVLLAHSLGERPYIAEQKADGTAMMLGETGDVMKFKDGAYEPVKVKDKYYNKSFWSAENSNLFYKTDNNGLPVYIYNEYDHSSFYERISFEDPDEAKKYIFSSMDAAKESFKEQLLGIDFAKRSELTSEDFPEAYDSTITKWQNIYRHYLNNDGELLQGVLESDDEFQARSENTVARILSDEEKREQILEHIDTLCDSIFGKTDGIGTEDSPIVMNVANISEYSGKSETNIITAMKKCGHETVFDLMQTDEYNMNRIRETMVSYDEQTGVSLIDNRNLSPFMEHVRNVTLESLQAQGMDVTALDIDDHGIIRYSGTCVNKMFHNAGEQAELIPVTGHIGQIFEPDENGVIITKYNHDDNIAIIPKYNAIVERPDWETNLTLEQRTICRGYQELLDQKIKLTIHNQFVKRSFDNIYNETRLNGIYRNMYSKKVPVDYINYYRAKGMDDEYINALIKTERSVVRYPTEYKDGSALNTWYLKNKDNIINDICNDSFARTNENIALLNNCVACDDLATGGALNQGIIRYMREHASVDENGHLVAPINVDGTINEKDRMPLFNLHAFRYITYNPADRIVMVASNAKDCAQIDYHTKTAHGVLRGRTMEDGYVVSQEYANRHLIPCENVEETKKLDPELIKAFICNKDGFLNIVFGDDGKESVQFYGRNYSLDEVNRLYNLPDNDRSKEDLCAEYIKQELTANNIGLRVLGIGDKICDLGGNKGVISYVVDRNLPDEVVEELGLTYEVELFRSNPELEVVGAPFTAASRMNAGTVREMMENAGDLKLPDGRVIKGGLGTLTMIITDKFADEKTHIYDDEAYLNGKGRNASSQFAWQLQAVHADKFMQYVYGKNDKHLYKVRERLIALGYDLDKNQSPVKGYSPRTIMQYDETGTERNYKEKRDIIDLDISGSLIAADEDGTRSAFNVEKINHIIDKLEGQISKKGGFLRVPFEIELESGIMTPPADDGKGGYLLPVLPPQMRCDETYDDGSKITHDYTRTYLTIARQALYYTAYTEQQDEYKRLLSENPSEWKSDKVSVLKKKLDGTIVPRDKKDIRNRYNKSVTSQEAAFNKAQAVYNTMAEDIHETYFTGKKNVFKTELMTRPLEDSATALWSSDPSLALNECYVSDEIMEKFGIQEGDQLVLWRDPLLRLEDIAVVTVAKRKKGAPPLRGIAVNPVIAKRFDGDFDGDTTALVSLSDRKMCHEVEVYDKRIDTLLHKLDSIKLEQPDNTKDIEKLETQIARAKSEYDNAIKKLEEFREAKEEIIRLFSVENTLVDYAQTPDNPKSTDEVVFALNMGLDIASVKASLKERGITIEVPGDDGSLINVMDLPDLAKKDVIHGNNKAALDKMNIYVKNILNHATFTDYNSYDSFESFYECQNRMIVDHKAKGKMKSMIECAKYANTGITFVCEGDDHIYSGEEMLERISSDKDAVFRINTAEGAVVDYGESAITVEINNPNLTEEQRNEIIFRKNEMKNMVRDVFTAVQIKTVGTGNAGAVSQKGIKLTRGLAALDTLEITYGATQGILQAKHDAKQAQQLYTVLRDTLPTLLNGHPIMYDDKKGWIPDYENKDKKLSKQEFVQQYYDLCNSSTGLNYEICRQRIENLADVLYTKDSDGKDKFISIYSEENVAVLDRCAYPKNGDSLAVIKEIAEANEHLEADKRVSLFNSNSTKQFIPDRERVRFDYNNPVDLEEKNAEHVKTICFTGHRPDKLAGYGNEKEYQEFVDRLKKELVPYIEQGYSRFITGGAQGADQLAFWAVEGLKKQGYDNIKNVVYVPYKGQESRWRANDGMFTQNDYQKMLSKADEVKYVSHRRSDDSREAVTLLMDRNHAMCNDADLLIGVYEGNDYEHESGGTAECLRYADKIGLDKHLIHFKEPQVEQQHQPSLSEPSQSFANSKNNEKQNMERAKQDNDSEKSKRILLIGPTPDKLYGNENNRETKDKYNQLYKQIYKHVNNLYDEGYREFTTIADSGYNECAFNAVERLKKKYPDEEIKNLLIVPSKDCYTCYPNDTKKYLFTDERMKAMLDKAEGNRYIVSEGKYSMEQVVSKFKNVSAYPGMDNTVSWKQRNDDILFNYMQIIYRAKHDMIIPDFTIDDNNNNSKINSQNQLNASDLAAKTDDKKRSESRFNDIHEQASALQYAEAGSAEYYPK